MTASTAPDLRSAMTTFPSGVTIVTTRDEAGEPWGFTASAFSSLSLDPPLVLVCLTKTAQSYDVFMRAHRWNIHIVGAEHAELAFKFATRGADKFAGGEFEDVHGLPALSNVPARIECVEHAKLEGGDHTIFIGRVVDVEKTDVSPAVYHDKKFHQLGKSHD
ncbi:flavin reductase family protein [Dietzia maris]